MTEKSIPVPLAGQPGIPAWITLLIAIASGAIVANLYYAQPLAGPISASTGLPPGAAGLVVTLTQIGYCLGLLFIVPLGDLLENRRLIVGSLAVTVVALAGVALAAQAWQFLTATLLVGLGSVAAQVLVPYAAHLAPDATRGRVVGNVMSGLLLGILLARPVASLIANALGWHWVFGLSAFLITVLAIVLGRTLPPRHPRATIGYGALMRSLWTLLRETPVLRRRSAYHALLFASFSLFWTVVPLLLAGPRFHMTQAGIAWFALAGVAGAVSAPVAGRLADSGWTRPATGFALGVSALAFVILHVTRGSSTAALLVLVFAAVLLDMGVSANLVLGQRAIFALGANVRSRLNGLYMAIFFAGGATGSAVGGFAYARGGWPLATLLGLGMPVAALAMYATEFKRAR